MDGSGGEVFEGAPFPPHPGVSSQRAEAPGGITLWGGHGRGVEGG